MVIGSIGYLVACSTKPSAALSRGSRDRQARRYRRTIFTKPPMGATHAELRNDFH